MEVLKQPLEHPNLSLNILYGFRFRLDILCKAFFPFLVLGPLEIPFLAELERTVVLRLFTVSNFDLICLKGDYRKVPALVSFFST